MAAVSGQPSPAIGTEIGDYRLEAVLGRGGMGVVYRATDTRLGRKVALKLLPPELSQNRSFQARFLRESRLAASIDHPGVIPIYEAGDIGGQLYIAMRHVEGTDLAQLLRDEGALEPQRAVALVGQLAAALDAAHGRGLVHRDIKPSNALVDGDHVYLSDFGLSQEAAESSAQGDGVVGTVRYMAPEVIRSGEATPQSDVYSLGCVLFECLTGEPPFPAASDSAVIYGHLESPPPRPSERRPGVPRALDAVVAGALEKDPTRRFGSAAEFLQALRAAAASAPRRQRRVVVLVGLALALVVAAAVLRQAADDPEPVRLAADAVGVIDPKAVSLTGQVALDGSPDAITAGAGAVWVTDEQRGVVSRVDRGTRTIRQTIPVGHGPAAVAAEPAGVWVANSQDGTLSVISPQTNQVVDTVRVGRSVDGLCIGGGSVWVASPLDYAVMRFDPETGRRTATVRLDAQPGRLACGSGAVWVSSPAAGTVTRISAADAAPAGTVRVGRGASALAVGHGSVSVANPSDGTVARIDPGRLAVTARVQLTGASEIAATADALWVGDELGGTVARIDPERMRVTERLRVGNRPRGLAVVDGALWVAVADTGRRHRGGTLRLEYALKMGWRDIDPMSAGSAESYELLSLVYDGLTGFRRQGGAAGLTLVPNLAEALPSPTDGGRTYTFRLRRGLRYSSGEPVRAGDVRFSMERALAQGPGPFGRVRGAGECTPQRCDLSRGIVTDDAAGTVTFHLTRADGDLLQKLSLASVLPPEAGETVPARRPLPGTGPYVIAAFQPRRSLRMERNRRFRPWSRADRPDGYPDVIEVRFGSKGDAAVDRVLAGRTDRINTFGTLPPGRIAGLRRRAPGQLRLSIAPITSWFVMNTRRAPFDRLDARRAVAFAFDRRAAAATAGAEAAVPTCQFLPPTFPGSRPYCPFTRSQSGGIGPPDVERARRLVRRSGTRGRRVTVLWPDIFEPALGQLMVRTLRRIGYRASLRRLPVDEHFARLGDRRRAQIGLMPWAADYASPLTFLRNFSCDTLKSDPALNQNPSQYCDAKTERLLDEAERVQPVDPVAADALWAKAERRLVDQAPAVAAYNLVVADLVAERLGNYQNNPLVGMLIEQAWVR